jgi:hypothetical protein
MCLRRVRWLARRRRQSTGARILVWAGSPLRRFAGQPSSYALAASVTRFFQGLAALILQVARRRHVIWGSSAEGRGRVAAERVTAAAAAAAVVRRAETCVGALPCSWLLLSTL